mmetsp:Transcript_15887/g.60516  ORF Transcript_15887/g.60516 Transcript_15887/m.60516 type:complete len:208 (-) Transcript_15887:626-1249(-)
MRAFSFQILTCICFPDSHVYSLLGGKLCTPSRIGDELACTKLHTHRIASDRIKPRGAPRKDADVSQLRLAWTALSASPVAVEGTPSSLQRKRREPRHRNFCKRSRAWRSRSDPLVVWISIAVSIEQPLSSPQRRGVILASAPPRDLSGQDPFVNLPSLALRYAGGLVHSFALPCTLHRTLLAFAAGSSKPLLCPIDSSWISAGQHMR